MIHADILHLADRYAQAWFALSGNQMTEASIQSLKEVVQYIQKHNYIVLMLQLSIIDDEIKYQALDIINDMYQLPAGYREISRLLITHKRSFLFPTVFTALVRYYWKQKNIEWFSVISSHPLSHKDQRACSTFLTTKRLSDVRCEYMVDQSLIAGIRMQSDHYVWEHSINKQLKKIGHSLVR